MGGFVDGAPYRRFRVRTCVDVIACVCVLDCDIPFQPIGTGCYFYDETLYIDSFPATVDFCETLGGYPVVVRHGEENRALIDHIYPDNREYPSNTTLIY